jgi:hypothetical protein
MQTTSEECERKEAFARSEVERAADPFSSPIQDMGIDHGGGDILANSSGVAFDFCVNLCAYSAYERCVVTMMLLRPERQNLPP